MRLGHQARPRRAATPAVPGDYLGGAYALVVHTRDGHTERVASWNGLPGKTMQLTAATASPQDQITSVVLTQADGTPVASLRL